MSFLQNTSCTAQPCLTLTQLRDEFFFFGPLGGILEHVWDVEVPVDEYTTAPVGNTTLVFLPGTHTLDNTLLSFYGNNSLISFSGLSNELLLDPVINGSIHRIASSYLVFTDIAVLVTHLQFKNCSVHTQYSDSFVVDHVAFSDSLLIVKNIRSASIINTNITITEYGGPEYVCFVLSTESSRVSITNLLLSIAIVYSSCISVRPLLAIAGGSSEIVDSTILGNGNYILAVAETNLTVLGTVQFEHGNPAIMTQRSTVNLRGSITFENGNTAIKAQDSTVEIAGNVLFANGNTAIETIGGIVGLAGNISFINNTGYQGGAMYISGGVVVIDDNAHIVFQDNHADHVGGAIYSTGIDIIDYISVGLKVDFCQMSFGANSRVEFINNTAKSGGSAMYGVTVSKLVCDSTITYAHHKGVNTTYDDLLSILSIEPDVSSAVSSDPLRVCICPDQSTPDCLAILPDQNIPHLHYTVYPGQIFTIPAAVVGFNFALTSGSVYAQFLSSEASLGSDSQYVQGVNQTGCSQLQYSVLSAKIQETLVLTSNGRSVSGIPSSIDQQIEVENGIIVAVEDIGVYFCMIINLL